VQVEGGRSLSWVWEGTAARASDGALTVSVLLQKADFVKSRGALVRTAADAQPVVLSGRFTVGGAGLTGSFTGPEVQATEAWASRLPSGAAPIFARDVVELPTHGELSAAEKRTRFEAFSSYHELPEVKPYVSHPLFQAAIHTAIVDKTDFDFYQKHPMALRVVGKVVDPISLQETLARANAYRWTLAGKAAYYDDDTAKNFVDPATGMILAARVNGVGIPSNDSALWTGAWIASQAYRYQITASPEALSNVVKSVNALMTLVEITGDPKTFARTLRAPTGQPPVPPWHAGVGLYAGLEWKEGGNNDMFKGVMYGLITAHTVLCDPPTGHDFECQRIKNNAKHIADDLEEANPNGQNRLAAQWFAAYLTHSFKYILSATTQWNIQSEVLNQGNVTMVYSKGTADWSGTHLGFVGYNYFGILASRYELKGIDSGSTLRHGIENINTEFSKTRMGLWSVAFATMGTQPHPEAAENARWRLRELPAPKTQLNVDHRINDAYVMSPFPVLPWKNDWTTSDRTQSLRMYPLFESSTYAEYSWSRSPLDYKVDTTFIGYPGVDFSLAYWFGRAKQVLSAEE
jgi:hypothetical protein